MEVKERRVLKKKKQVNSPLTESISKVRKKGNRSRVYSHAPPPKLNILLLYKMFLS